MKKGFPAGYNVKRFHKDQKKLLGVKAVQDFDTTVGFVTDFFYDLNFEIIRNLYEFKIPSRGGHIRIGKSRRGIFFWQWEKAGDYCNIPKKNMWSFEPVVGWINPVQIGERGLKKWIVECKQDPRKPNYDVPHRYSKVPIKGFYDYIKDSK